MVRNERKNLLDRCNPDSPSIEAAELMYYINQLADYCDELEFEISRMCKTCRKCKLALGGSGDCKNWVVAKTKQKSKSANVWNDWFG